MATLSLSALEQAIYNWLVPAYVPYAIFANQRVPQPAYPYASVLMLASAREGGRDPTVTTQGLTRAKLIRLTPTVANLTTYTITINGTAYSYTSGATATASAITAGLKAAMAAATQTVTDNHGTLDVTSTTLYLVVVTSNLSWANLDAGHEILMTSKGSRRLSFQITVHVDEANMVAGGAYAWAETIRSSLSFESVVSALDAAGIAIVKDGGVRDLSSKIDGQWISRAAFDVVFRALVQPTDDVGYIASFTATGTIDDDLPDEQTVVLTGP